MFLWVDEMRRLTENLSNVAKAFEKAFNGRAHLGRNDFPLEIQMLQLCGCAKP